MSRKYSSTIHDFYCSKCGNFSIPLARRRGHKHKRFHKKKLYCICCKEETNHIECQTEEDAKEFKINFEKGVYLNA